jgi:nitrate reductase gamma subunit
MNWLGPLVYGAIAVFLAGMIWRLVIWLRTPVPLNIVLTPGPTTTGGVARRMAGEAFLFRSLWRADRGLWCAAWLFHVSLVLLAIGHVAGLVIPGAARTMLGLTEQQFHWLAQVSGAGFGVLAAIPLLYLLLRRFTLERVRYLSTWSDYFAVGLLLLVVATGNQMRFMDRLDLAQARGFVSGLLVFHPVPPPGDVGFIAHVLLVCGLLIYIPFSKLIHLGGIFLSPTLNQQNNPRERRHTPPPQLSTFTFQPAISPGSRLPK